MSHAHTTVNIRRLTAGFVLLNIIQFSYWVFVWVCVCVWRNWMGNAQPVNLPFPISYASCPWLFIVYFRFFCLSFIIYAFVCIDIYWKHFYFARHTCNNMMHGYTKKSGSAAHKIYRLNPFFSFLYLNE